MTKKENRKRIEPRINELMKARTVIYREKVDKNIET